MTENPFEFGRAVEDEYFIDIDADTVYFNDPFFKLWIKRNIVLL